LPLYRIRELAQKYFETDFKQRIVPRFPTISTIGLLGIVFVAIIAFGEAGAHAALVIALAYIIQVQSAAWYVKFTDKVFGPETTEVVEVVSTS
jgi:ACR3 family arsenite efflux pump ArsB